jgi:hypothetical protein
MSLQLLFQIDICVKMAGSRKPEAGGGNPFLHHLRYMLFKCYFLRVHCEFLGEPFG